MMKAPSRFHPCLAAVLVFACLPGNALGQTKGAAVRLLSAQPQRNLKEGKATRPFAELAPQEELRLEIFGPRSLVLLVRGGENRAAVLNLVLDGRQQGEVSLDVSVKVSRGVFLSVEDGTHQLSVSCDVPLLVHALPLKRKQPMAGEASVVFREISRPPPAAPAGQAPASPSEAHTAAAAAPPAAAAPAVEAPPAVAAPLAEPPAPDSSIAAAVEENATIRVLPVPAPPMEPSGPGEWGGAGLWHTVSARAEGIGRVGLGASIEYFKAKDFLTAGDEHERLRSRLSVAVRPLAGLEVNAGVLLSSNRNRSFVPADSLTVGDPWLGVRYGYPLLKWLSAGLWIQSVFPAGSGMTELASDGISTRILFLFDFHPLPALRLHLNLGYHFDNTKRIFDYPLTTAQKFAAGVNPHDQFLLRLGGAWQLGPVAPFLEFSLDPAMGAEHLAFSDNPAQITLGVRGWPFADHRLHLLAAVDIGVMGTGPSGPEGVSTPPYNVVLAVGYCFGAEAPRIEVREVVRTERVAAPAETCVGPEVAMPGRVSGQVLDARTGKPVGGARVTVGGRIPSVLLSDPETGRFITCPSAAGPLKITVFKEGFAEQSQVVLVTGQPETPVSFRLEPATGEARAALKGTVRSLAGAPLMALVAIPAKNLKIRAEKGSGAFSQVLPAGTYDVLISMPGFVTQRRKVTLGAGDVVILNVELEPQK